MALIGEAASGGGGAQGDGVVQKKGHRGVDPSASHELAHRVTMHASEDSAKVTLVEPDFTRDVLKLQQAAQPVCNEQFNAGARGEVRVAPPWIGVDDADQVIASRVDAHPMARLRRPKLCDDSVNELDQGAILARREIADCAAKRPWRRLDAAGPRNGALHGHVLRVTR